MIVYLIVFKMCVVVSNNKGRIYRPKNSERLILHLKNLNHVKPDKWGSIHLAAFLQQVRITFIKIITYINCSILKRKDYY